MHKGLSPFTWRDGVTFALVFVIAGLSNAGGVGGGFLFVPILVLLTGFRAHVAATVSQALVTGASGANTVYGLVHRHPSVDRPRIDYYVVTNFVPTILCGTAIGVFLNELFPDYFTMFVLAALVLYVFYVSLRRALVLLKRERQAQTAANAEPESVTVTDPEECTDTDDDKEGDAHSPDSDAEPGPVAAVGPEEPPPTNGGKEHNEHPPDAPAATPPSRAGFTCAPVYGFFVPSYRFPSLEELLAYERRQFPLDALLYVFLTMVFLVLLALFRGGGNAAHSLVGVPLCSAAFWVLFAIQEAGLLGLGAAGGARNLHMHHLKVDLKYSFYEHDFVWTRWRVLWISPIMLVLGAIGAWVGAGGSFMSTPVLIAGIGMDPLVVQSTAGFMNFITALSSAIQYLFNHELPIAYAASLGGAALAGSFTFILFLNHLVRKYHLQAILVFVMSFVMLGAFAVNVYAAVYELRPLLAAGQRFPIRDVCRANGRR